MSGRAGRLGSRSNNERGRISVLIADDHPIVLAGLESLLQRESDISVIGHCSDGVEALRAVTKHEPDVLLLDLKMPGANGVAVLEEMRKHNLPTRVIVLAAAIDDDELLDAIRLGAAGVLLKEIAPRSLMTCIRQVHAGHQWFEQRVVGEAMEKMMKREAAAKELHAVLSRRELDVVRGVAKGLRNREIAHELGIAEGTIKLHLHTIYTKLNVDGRTALLLKVNVKSLV